MGWTDATGFKLALNENIEWFKTQMEKA